MYGNQEVLREEVYVEKENNKANTRSRKIQTI
jgi:hypothetical protein